MKFGFCAEFTGLLAALPEPLRLDDVSSSSIMDVFILAVYMLIRGLLFELILQKREWQRKTKDLVRKSDPST